MPVRGVLMLLMVVLLIRAPRAMAAGAEAARLFVEAVLPGLFPYLVAAQMLVSRMGPRPRPWQLMLLGWAGGSPTGARLAALRPGMPLGQRRQLAVRCATLSPMFLSGTLGQWLGSPRAGACVLAAVLLSGWLAGLALRGEEGAAGAETPPVRPMSLTECIAGGASAMLTACGAMILMRVLAALLTEWTDAVCPALSLPLTTLLEVTTGAKAIAALPLPLMWRTALMAGAAGFGGASLLVQVRAALGGEVLPLRTQVLRQGLHGTLAFLLALGMAFFVL